MQKFIKWLLRSFLIPKKEEHVYYKLIQKILIKHGFTNLNKINFLGGFQYNNHDYQTLKELIHIDIMAMSDFLESRPYEVKSDNILVFYLEVKDEDKYYIISIFDPYELYQIEYLMDIFPYSKITEDLGEQVFP
jgi:hypothetical protein